MTTKEALRRMRICCEIIIGKLNKSWAFRNISNEFCKNYEQVEKEIKKLEDIEEELGIDLVTLFKVLKGQFWFKYNGTISKCYYDDKIYLENFFGIRSFCIVKAKSLLLCNDDWVYKGEFYFKDYGKTWALTKEELE